MSTTTPQTRHAVTALIVAHDGAQLLPGLVRALAGQTYQVEQTIGVDTGSRDRSGAVLAELIGQDAVIGTNRSTGYGEAVAVALRHAARARSRATDPGIARVEWIWLLHDDCEPAPDALERLLRAASRDRSVVVVGPKVIDGQDRRTLREVGVAIDRAGRRVTGIDPGEIDQGQHDHKRAVLAVGSAGMLVRRDVWDRLGGFDPTLKLFRDDVDFCWRVQGAGLRVQVATGAILYHRELAARRRRPAEGGSPRRLDRRNALYVLAVNLPLLAMLRVVGGCLIGSLARAVYFLLTKQLDQAAAYGYSVAWLLAHPIRVIKARHRRSAGLAEGYDAVRVFIPPARTTFRLAEKIAGLVSNGPPQVSSGRHHATTEESEEDEQFTDQQSVMRRLLGHPGAQLCVALLLVALIAERRLLSTSPLGGGALVPAWGGSSALWQEYLAGFHAVSVGSTASAPPYLAVVAALGTVLGGQAWLAVDVLLLGCVPLAGLTAYYATRRLVSSSLARVLLAAAYALLPVATGAVAAGRLGTAVALIVLPLVAVSAGRMLTAPPRQARRAAWAAGLLIALAAAFAPLTWVLGAVLAVSALAARRWLVTASPVNAAIVVVTPFLVLFPWSLHLLTSPSAFLSEAGLTTPGLSTRGLSPTALLALSPGGPGLPPVWVTAGFAVALLALVVPVKRTRLVVTGWAVAIAGLLAAVAVSRISVTSTPGVQPSDGWPGAAMALAALGLLLASAPATAWLAGIIQNDPAAPSATTAPAPGYSRPKRLLACGALVALASAPLLVGGYWLKDGVRGPVGNVAAPLLPAFVSASSTSGQQYRTLILRPDGAGLDYQVVRQGDPSLGEPELGTDASARAALSRQVAALVAPDGADAGDPGLVLGSFGIKWVLLPSPVDTVLAQRLDAALGLVALNKGPSYDLWQVTGAIARVRVAAADGTTPLSSGLVNLAGVTAPASGGTLILAEPYSGWTATLNGRALHPLASPLDGWAQGFTLPPGGGQLSITRNDLARELSLFLELLATLVMCLFALPGKRVDPVEEAEAVAALREARDRRRTPRPARRGRVVRGDRAGGIGGLGIGLGRLGLARKRPADGQPSPELEPTGQAPLADDASVDLEPAAAPSAGRGDPARRTGGQSPPPADREPWGTGPQSPVLGSPLPETLPPWETRPQSPSATAPRPRYPRHSGPQSPPSSPGIEPRHPWESGPQRPVAPADARSASGTGPRRGWEENSSEPAGSSPARPAPRTGAQPASVTGAQPVSRPSSQPVPQPGSHPVPRTGSQPVSRTGGQPVSRTGGQSAAPDGTQPVAMAPWESDDWRKARDWEAISGPLDIPPAPRAKTGPENGSGGQSDGGQPAKAERHSHRAAKHGRPRRWRGSGNRSAGEDES